MVDYSKWNTLDDDSGAEEDRPRVQKFDKPQSVTIGGQSNGVVKICPWKDQQEFDTSAPGPKVEEVRDDEDDDEPMEPPDEDVEAYQPGDDYREECMECRGLAERALRKGEPAEAVRLLEKAMRMGGAECPGLEDTLKAARAALNPSATQGYPVKAASQPLSPEALREAQLANGGSVGDRYCWSQTRDTVVVNVFVPDDTKAKIVSVQVDDITVSLSAGGVSYLKGEWPYKVDPEEDPDWELRDVDGRRAVTLTIRKAPMPGGYSVVTWWRSVLKGDPWIKVEEIKDRKQKKNAAFSKAWKEATVNFREKTANHKPILIDKDGNVVSDEEEEKNEETADVTMES